MKTLVTATMVSLTLSSFAQSSFDGLSHIKSNTAYSQLLLKSYPMSFDELRNFDKQITVQHLEELSVLANSLDLSDTDQERNKLVLDILTRNGLPGLRDMFSFTLDTKVQETAQGIDALRKLAPHYSKMVSLNLRLIVEKYFQLLIAKRTKDFDQNYVPEPIVRDPNVYILWSAETPKAPKEIDDFQTFLNSFESEELKSRYPLVIGRIRVRENQNSDLLLPLVKVSQGAFQTGNLSGSYTNSTKCNSETIPVNKALEIKDGRKLTCDPGNYSKGAVAGVAPYFFADTKDSSEPGNDVFGFSQMGLGMLLTATGGYSCDNYMGSPKDCKDHTATASANFTGVLQVDRCTDIYACDLLYQVMVEANGQGYEKYSTQLDGKAVRNELILRDENHEIMFKYQDSVSHRGGSGANMKNNFYRVMVAKVHQNEPVAPPRIPGPSEINLSTHQMKRVLLNVEAINKLTQSFRAMKATTQKRPAFASIELASIYTVLSFIEKNIDKFNGALTQKAARIIQQNLSNRARELREISLRNELKEKVSDYKNRFGANNLYLSTLESIINDETRMQSSFEEYEQIVEKILTTKLKDSRVDFATKKAVLVSLYTAELLQKNILISEIKDLLSELTHYQDLSEEYVQLKTELN